MKILITGTAGFIGFHLVSKLIGNPDVSIVGLDNINDYYSVKLKEDRLAEQGIVADEYAKLIQSNKFSNYSFIKLNLEDYDNLKILFQTQNFDVVVNLAAQAGVRYSLENPHAYINANLVGFTNILECCKQNNIKHLIFASSSSVYGLNTKMPFAVEDATNHPVSLYAATKKANELLAHSYSHLYKLPVTGLRFFTVYGTWGRPDMSYYLFADAIRNNKSINVFNNGEMLRDFTYVDDVVEGIKSIIEQGHKGSDAEWDSSNPKAQSSSAPYRIYNIGNNKSENLLKFINTLENELGKEAQKKFLPLQPGDVKATFADVSSLENDYNYKPSTTIEEGLKQFVNWYKSYYKL